MIYRQVAGHERSIFAILLAVLLSASAWTNAEGQNARPAQDFAFVLTTDYYSAGYYSTIKVVPPRDTQVNISPVSTDAIAYYHFEQDMVFVVNRYLADNIQLVDPNQNFATVGQYSVGNGSNPQDIRVASGQKAYVSRFEWKTLLIVNPFTGAVLDSIDLSPLADADGIPEMGRMEIVDDRLFVTLGIINHTTWEPAGPGKVAVIDMVTDTLIDADPGTPGVQAIILECPNPYSELRYEPYRDLLVVGCIGSWGTLDGGVEAIDPVTLESVGVVISESEIGGDIYDALLATAEKGYAVVMDPAPWPDNLARLVAFDAITGEVTDTLYAQTGGFGASMASIELNTQEEVYLCDRDVVQPRVRIYDSVADTLMEAIDVGLPPYDIAFVQPPPLQRIAARENPRAFPGVFLDQNYPNPFNPETVIPFRLAEEAWVRVQVFDVQGRRLARLLDGLLPPGLHSVHWSGRDDAGGDVPAGVFFCRLCAGEVTASRKMILIR